MPAKNKTRQLVKSVKKNFAPARKIKTSDALIAAIDVGIDPFSIVPTGTLYFDNPRRKLQSKKWRIGADADELFHIFSLLARNHTIAEVVEDFVLFYLDWSKIQEIGAKQAAKSKIELMELKSEYDSLPDGVDPKHAKSLLFKMQSFIEVHQGDYSKELVSWLKRSVTNVIMYHRSKWEPWMAEEHRLWISDKSRAIPCENKGFRLAMYDRLLEYEWSKTQKSSKSIIEILKAIKDEVEGHVTTVNWNIEDVSDSIMNGSMSREDWLEVIGVMQRMLIAAAKGEPVEDMRRLVADTYGSDLVIEAEAYLQESGL